MFNSKRTSGMIIKGAYMDVTRKKYLALVGAVIVSTVFYVAKPKEELNMSIKVTAQGKV